MLRMFSKKINNRKGFTLIELIVVIAILGILAAIAVPKFGGFTDSAKTQADAATCKTIQTAVTVALTNDDISGKGTITVNNTGDKFKSESITVKDGTDIATVMGKLLQNDIKAQVDGKTGFVATIDENGDVTVATATD